MLQRQRLHLWSVDDIESGRAPAADAAALRTIAAWSRSFLIPDHPDLGRDGPVCPFTKTSMEKQLFYLTALHTPASGEGIAETIAAYTDWYRELAEQTDRKDRTFLTVLIVLPDMNLADSSPLDRLQRSLKDQCVSDGLMIGQFHPACDQPGLWNEDFRPLRSPIPLLAIRTMVQYDLPFLMESGVHLAAYLQRFAPAIPAHLRAQLAKAVTRASMTGEHVA